MRLIGRSMRSRLALTGFCAIYFPVLTLFAVFAATTEEDRSLDPATSAVFDTTSTERLPGVVIATAILLAPIAAALAWWWSGRAVRPIRRLQEQLDGIGGNDLHQRVSLVSASTEIETLGERFNAMLERVETAAATQQHLIDDTSHELRTPLAILVTSADVALGDPQPSIETYASAIERSRTTAQQMAAIVDDLLVNARRQARTIQQEPVDLSVIASTTGDSMRPLAEARDVRLLIAAPTAVFCNADRASLGRAVRNLIDNAIRFAPRGTEVMVDVAQDPHHASITVTDRGPGITAAAQDGVFNRSQTAGSDPLREQTGIGLSIVKAVAEAHGGSVDLTSPVSDHRGTQLTLRIPACHAPDPTP
jgi:signal transduction histidine kinase